MDNSSEPLIFRDEQRFNDKLNRLKGRNRLRYALYTLGCKVNQVETEALEEGFGEPIFARVDFAEPSDIYVINTCSVTQTAVKKSRSMIRRAGKANPAGLVIVTGCMSQVNRDELLSLPEVDLVVDNRAKEKIGFYLQLLLESKDLKAFQLMPSSPYIEPARYTKRHTRTRGFVKIQDGCESFCSFCIVPYARGPVRSKHPQGVAAEIESLLELGYKEMVLSGIHIGQYGNGLPGWDLLKLIKYLLDRIPGNYRLRLGSLEPHELGDDLIQLAAGEKRICRHFHIPLQSGNDVILERMNRNYNSGQYLRLLHRIHTLMPNAAITADVMVGFPGEGEPEFLDTVRLIKESPLTGLHVFRYSPRPGTPACSYSGQVPEGEKIERSQQLMELGEQKQAEFIDRQLGQELIVLTENRSAGGCKGLTDNYIEVIMEQETEVNRFYRAQLLRRAGKNVWAAGKSEFFYHGSS